MTFWTRRRVIAACAAYIVLDGALAIARYLPQVLAQLNPLLDTLQVASGVITGMVGVVVAICYRDLTPEEKAAKSGWKSTVGSSGTAARP